MSSGIARTPGPAALLELDDPRRGRLVVHSGETVVLLGPSGAGKTALIRALLGLEGKGPEPVLAVRGQPAPTRQLAALVGWVPEGDGVFLSDTVWDNVARPPSVPPIDPALARDALDLVGLAARAAEPVANLPRQGRRRVALARALASRRPLLVVDGELDPALWSLFPGVLEQAPGVEGRPPGHGPGGGAGVGGGQRCPGGGRTSRRPGAAGRAHRFERSRRPGRAGLGHARDVLTLGVVWRLLPEKAMETIVIYDWPAFCGIGDSRRCANEAARGGDA